MTNNSILTLYALRIPGWKDGAPASINAHGGIPLALTYLYPEGVKTIVDAYLGMEVDDSIHLYLNDAEVDVAHVKALTEKSFALYLPVKALLNGSNSIYYIVRRGSQNMDTSTTLLAWFHKVRPGIKDLEANHEWHSELAIDVLPPQVRDDGVDPEQARKGVICTAFYPLMRAHDKIRLMCAGEKIEKIVTETEAISGQSVQIQINESVFRQVGDTPKCVLTYTVWDWIGNSVDLDALWSATIDLFVSLNGTWFESPLISEDPNDASDDPDSIDLGKLSGNPAIAQIHAQRSWLKGDIIELTCTFTAPTGAIEVLVLRETVNSAPFIYKVPVPHAQFEASKDGFATFKYKLLRSGIEEGRSFTSRVDVIGEALIDLPPVTVVGVPSLEVDALAAPAGQIARVEFTKAQPGDKCQLLVRPVTTDGLPTYAAKPFNVNNRVNNTLTIEDLVARHGSVVRLVWELTRGLTKNRSKPTLLTVKKIDDEDPRLPRPKVAQAPDDKLLDLSQFDGDADVTELPWLGIREGQLVWVMGVGTNSNGSERLIPLLEAHIVTATEVLSGLSMKIERSQLIELQNDSTFRLELRVAMLPGNSATVLFPILRLKMVVVPPVTNEGFETGIVGSKPVGTLMDFPSMTVMVVRGTVSLGANGSSYAPPITLKYLYIAPGATLRFTLKTAAKSVRFGIADSSRIPSSVQCYDERGQLIVSRSTPAYGGTYQVWADFSGTADRKIKIIDITDGGGDSFLDNFTMQY